MSSSTVLGHNSFVTSSILLVHRDTARGSGNSCLTVSHNFLWCFWPAVTRNGYNSGLYPLAHVLILLSVFRNVTLYIEFSRPFAQSP
jgi:hypothetical protein